MSNRVQGRIAVSTGDTSRCFVKLALERTPVSSHGRLTLSMTARFGWADPAFHAEFPAIRESSVLSHSPVGTDGHPASGPLGSDNQVVSNALVRDPAIQGVVRIDDSSTNSVAAVTEFVLFMAE